MRIVVLVRDLNYGSIDSIWSTLEEAKKRIEELDKVKSSYTRRFSWVPEEWEVKGK